jgi:hypothetical protein
MQTAASLDWLAEPAAKWFHYATELVQQSNAKNLS